MKFGFIGGTSRGFLLCKKLVTNRLIPEFCIILEEDLHENLKVSDDFMEFAKSNNIPCTKKKKLKDEDYDMIKKLSLDFIIVCGWRTLIKPEINQYIKIGLIAAHDSLLPKYRGFAPLNWAIINGEEKTGVTLFIINDGEVDSGDIILQKEVAIGKEENIVDVYNKIISATIDSYIEIINKYIVSGTLSTIKQNEQDATYTCKRVPKDGYIDWNKTSGEVYNLIRALVYPYSGAFFFYNGNKYEVRDASIGPQNHKIFSGNIPGRVISILEDGVEVLCKKGTILIKEIYNEETKTQFNIKTIINSIKIDLR